MAVLCSRFFNLPATKGNIYGVEWDGTFNSAWTRTDKAAGFGDPNPAVNNGTGSSPFDDIMPWSGMVIEEDATAGTLVSIPKYWYKWTRDGIKMKLQISDQPQDGFFTSPAHADRGDGVGERDIVYVARYHCGSAYKSQTGVAPLANITRAQARSSIHNLGGTIWQYDYAMYWTIMMLYLVEYANWNSQATIGYGCSPSGSKFNLGATDSMVYHTGTTAANRTTYGSIQYRHIEGLWDNVYDWCDGIYFSGSNVYCIKNPAQFSDTSGGTLIGQWGNSGGYISSWGNPTESGFEYALYPIEGNGSVSTFVCDFFASTIGAISLFVGGSFNNTQVYGAFCLYKNGFKDQGYEVVGCRVMKLPNAS